MPANNQTLAHRMKVHVQKLFTTAAQKPHQGACRNMGVICFGLTFSCPIWHRSGGGSVACPEEMRDIKSQIPTSSAGTKERIVVPAQHLKKTVTIINMPTNNQTAAHKMKVHAQKLFTTAAQKPHQGACRNMGVLCFGLTFWFFCVKTKERIVVPAQHLKNSNNNQHANQKSNRRTQDECACTKALHYSSTKATSGRLPKHGGNMFRLDFLVLLCQDKRTNRCARTTFKKNSNNNHYATNHSTSRNSSKPATSNLQPVTCNQ